MNSSVTVQSNGMSVIHLLSNAKCLHNCCLDSGLANSFVIREGRYYETGIAFRLGCVVCIASHCC
jgi:hypothetical protein